MKEEQFYQKGDEFLDWSMKNWPALATKMGVHDYDDQLGDYSRESVEGVLTKFKGFLQEIDKAEPDTYSKEGQIDHTLLKQLLKSQIREIEILKYHLKNPNYYLSPVFSGIMSLLMKDFAPLEDRLRSLLGRVKDIPGVMNNARKNLRPELVPGVWVDTSLDQLSMAPGLLTKLLPRMAEEHAPELVADFFTTGNKAAAAVEDFMKYLKEDVKPAAEGDFAVGEEIFNKILVEDHLVDYDAKELLAGGQEIFRETEEEMKRLAEKIDPAKTVEGIMEEARADHPEADELLAAYRKSMAASRKFVVTKNIASLPEQEKLTVVETPAYLRPIIPYAAYIQPGIFADDMEGFFLVTTVSPSASKKEKEEKLKGHYYAKLPITTLHEGYPGHHLQLSWSAISGSNIRKLGSFLSSLFVEGWAFYCEELMEQKGYIDSPIQKLGRLSDQLWRAARIILDVKLHCKDMKVNEAEEFLVDRCQLEKSNARAEVRRYTSTPTQPQSYLMGKIKILELIDKYKDKFPGKSLKEIHNDILKAGSLPPRLMKRHLF